MEESRPWGVTALAGLLFAAAAGGVILFGLLLISGPQHPAFQSVGLASRRLLFVAFPVGTLIAIGLGSGLLGQRRWAWAVGAALVTGAFSIAMVVLASRYRLWTGATSRLAARDEFLAQACWTFLTAVVFVYFMSTLVLNAFGIRRRLVWRAIFFTALVLATASGYGFASQVRRGVTKSLQWLAEFP